jgi:exosortase H (IPTLxxWG-CTERM-specific)
VVRFVLLFLVGLLIVGYGYSYLSATHHEGLVWLTETTATLSGGLASVFSGDVTWSGQFVTYRGFAVEIIDECTGVFEMVIYIVAVLAFSASIRHKIVGIVAGVPIIYLFNVIRVWVLMVAGATSWDLFVFLHLYLWQVTLVLIIASVWIGWLYLVVFREKKGTVAVSG